jgi:hypothetical protein
LPREVWAALTEAGPRPSLELLGVEGLPRSPRGDDDDRAQDPLWHDLVSGRAAPNLRRFENRLSAAAFEALMAGPLGAQLELASMHGVLGEELATLFPPLRARHPRLAFGLDAVTFAPRPDGREQATLALGRHLEYGAYWLRQLEPLLARIERLTITHARRDRGNRGKLDELMARAESLRARGCAIEFVADDA